MTRALARRLGAPVRLTLLRAGPVRATPMESRRLGLRRRAGRVYGREIELALDGAAMLRARTVTRLDDPTVPLLEGLGGRPLAELLFESRRFRRDPAIDLLLPRGPGRDALLHPAGQPGTPAPGPDAVLGRCCRWRLAGRRRTGTLLVEEYFQPGLLARLATGS